MSLESYIARSQPHFGAREGELRRPGETRTRQYFRYCPVRGRYIIIQWSFGSEDPKLDGEIAVERRWLNDMRPWTIDPWPGLAKRLEKVDGIKIDWGKVYTSDPTDRLRDCTRREND